MGRYQKIRPLKLQPRDRAILLEYFQREMEILDETVDTAMAGSKFDETGGVARLALYYKHARSYLKGLISRFDPRTQERAAHGRKAREYTRRIEGRGETGG